MVISNGAQAGASGIQNGAANSGGSDGGGASTSGRSSPANTSPAQRTRTVDIQGGKLLLLVVFVGLSLLSYKYVHSGEQGKT